MNFSKIINYVLILVGGVVALYAQAGESQNVYVLIGGIVMLMTGIYRTSRNIPSKNTDEAKEEE
ncbi:hypothetical protein A9Q87_11405 [Flavobacteriales bacterium 34_180_T64]|nr:hypothetical protein A9Q87_11405 [Flavobacteriales bacterium 34_180_T64]